MKCTLIITLVTIGSLLTDLFAQYPVFVKDPYPYGSCLPDSALFAYLAKEDKVNDTTIYLECDEQVIVGFKNVKYLGEVRKQYRKHPRFYIYKVDVDTIFWLEDSLNFGSLQVLTYHFLLSKNKLVNYNVTLPTSVMLTSKYLLFKQSFDLHNKKKCIVNWKTLLSDIDHYFYSPKVAKFIELYQKKLE